MMSKKAAMGQSAKVRMDGQEMLEGLGRGKEGRPPLGIYVHIPFCKKKCKYCDFLSAPADKLAREGYEQALVRQIHGYRSLAAEYQVQTIYFGGGTPSFLESEEIGVLMEAIRESLGASFGAEMEVTLEANPGTLDGEKLRRYKELGFNRLSLGLQSMNPEELKLLGRAHDVEDFLESYDLARKHGFDNINVDLMSALPGQTAKSWEATLRKVAALEPEHISAYSLIIEEGTPFYEAYYGREELLPDEEEERAIYYRTEELLGQAGYQRYEISNYARPGRESRHNLSYWKGVDYLGLGLGASSLIKGERFSNEARLDQFTKAAGDLGKLVKERMALTREGQMEEFMFLGLRVMEGISKREFAARFGLAIEAVYGAALLKLEGQGLLMQNGDRIALTSRGIDVSNRVFVEFLLG